MSELPSWDDLRAFLAVLDGGSLSAAARELGIAQPTVRARVEALEHRLGTVLFTRSSLGLLPTEHARALHDHARTMAHAAQAFLRTASAPPGEVRGVVRLSVAEMVGVEVLPGMLAGLRAKHPGLTIEVALSNASVNIAEQEADIAVRMHAPAQDSLVARKVGDIALALFAHRDYVAARGQPATVDGLVVHDLIGPDRSTQDLRSAAAVFPPAVLARMVIRTDSHPAQLAAARAGLGIAVVHRALGLADTRLVRVLPEFVPLTLPVWVVVHRNLKREPRVRAAFDHLVACFAQYCGDRDAGLNQL